MTNNRDNRSSPNRNWKWWWPVSAVLTLVYVSLFFGQPSVFGLATEAGPLSRWADLSLLLLWGELVNFMTADGTLPLGISDRFPVLLGAAAWLAVAGAIGRPCVMRFAQKAGWTWTEAWTVAILVGLALLSSATLCVGLAGGLRSRLPLLMAIAALLFASRILAWRERRRLHATALNAAVKATRNAGSHGDGRSSLSPCCEPEPLPVRNVADRWAMHLLPVATVGLICLLLLGCLMPPWEFDVVEYHLAAPKEFAASGAIAFLPHNVYANMPLGAEMHSLAIMTLVGGAEGWWWGGLVGKLFTGCFSFLAAGLLGGFVARFCGRWSGWVAAALLLSVPGNEHVTIAGLVDSVLGAYILAMAVVLVSAAGKARSPGAWLLAGLLAGATASIKYTGFVFAIPPLIVCLGWTMYRNSEHASQEEAGRELHPHGEPMKRWLLPGAVALGFCVTCIPWLAKNAIQTGNPVYPLASVLFTNSLMQPERIEQWQAAHAVPVVEANGRTVSSFGIAALAQAIRHVGLASPFLSPTLIPLFLIGICWAFFISIRARVGPCPKASWILAWLSLVLWMLGVWWLATHRIDRFWIPILPLVTGIAATAVSHLARGFSLAFASSLVLLSIVYGALNLVGGVAGDSRFFVQLQALRTDAGDDQQPGRMSPSTLWINQNLNAPDTKLLLIGEARVFDFQPSIEYATCFDKNPAEEMLSDASPVEKLQKLRQRGITHVLVHWVEIDRYRSPGNYGFSPWPSRSELEALIAENVLVRVAWPYSGFVDLFKVVEGEPANSTNDNAPQPIK